MAGDFFSAQEEFNAAGRAFGQNVTKFAASIATFEFASSKFGKFSDEMRSVTDDLTRWVEVFSLSHIVLSIKELVREIDSVSADLTRTLGVLGSQREQIRNAIASQAGDLAQYGISISKITESQIALVKELRDFTQFSNAQLARTNALVMDVFGFAEEAGARVIGGLMRFGGATERDIRSFFEDTVTLSKDLNISYRDVADNIANSTHILAIFNTRSAEARKSFAQMAAYATAIGLDLGQAVDTSERFLSIQEAISGAAGLTRLGVGMSPIELLSMAQRGPGEIERNVLDRLTQIISPEMQGSAYARIIARGIGEQLGMTGPEVLDKLDRHRRVSELMLKTGMSRTAALEEIKKSSMTLGDRFEAVYKTILTDVAIPIGKTIIPVFETIAGWLAKLVDKVGGVGIMLTAAISIATTKLILAITRARLGGGIRETLSQRLASRFGEAAAPKSTITSPSDLPGMRFAKKSGFNFPAPAQLLATGAAMIAFAGSMWVLSKAFQNFSEGVSWKGVATGITIMGAFVGSMVLLTSILTTAAAPVAIGTALLIGLAGAMWISSKAFQNFSTAIQPLAEVDLMSVAKGIGAIGIAMSALAVGQIASGLGSITSFFAGNPLERLGTWSERYVDPITSMSFAVERLANSMALLSSSIEAIDIAKAKQISNELSSKEMTSMTRGGSTRSAEKVVPIENKITIEIDGQKVAGAVVKSLGIVR